MKRLVLSFLAVSALGLCSCSSRIVVVHVQPSAVDGGNAEKLPAEGIFYALPRTVVSIDAPVQLTESKPGKYVDFAPIFFPGEKAIRTEGKKLQLMAGKFTTVGEPDPKAVYYVSVKGGEAVDWSRTFQFNEDGTIADAKQQADNQTADIALGILSSAASIAGKFVSPGAKGGAREEVSEDCKEPKKAEAAVTCYLQKNVGSGFDQRFLHLETADPQVYKRILGSTQKNPQTSLFSVIEGSPLSAAVAEARTINSLQNAQVLMLTTVQAGVTISDAVLTRQDALIAERQKDFLGSETTSTWHGMFVLRPERLGDTPVLFRLNPKQGLCVVADLGENTEPPENIRYNFGTDNAGEKPVYCQEGGSGLEEVKLTFDPIKDQMLNRISARYATVKSEDDTTFAKEHGFRYRIPALVMAKLTTSAAGSVSSKSRLLIAQFGVLLALPASPGGKSVMYSLKYFATTGALQNFDLSTKAVLTKGAIDTGGSSAAAIVDARNKEAEKRAKEADQLNQLDRKRAILEDQVKIQLACKTLNIDCTSK